MRTRFWLLAAACFANVTGGPANAEVWQQLLPTVCVEAGRLPGNEQGSSTTVPEFGPKRIDTKAELYRVSEKAALATGIRVQDARRLVAEAAAERISAAAEATVVLEFLRELWIGGDMRAAFTYGQLAVRWPEVIPSPSPEQAFASAALGGSPQALLEIARLRSVTTSDKSAVAASVSMLVQQTRSLLWSRVASGQCSELLALSRLALDPVEGPREPVLAAAFMRAALERQVPGAAIELARLLLDGDGIPYDLDQALSLLENEKGAERKTALLMLARLRLAGPLPARDRRRAQAVISKLRSDQAPDSMGLVMLLAEDEAGRFGGKIDHAKAAEFLNKAEELAASQDHIQLARAYLQGWSGRIDAPAALRTLMSASSHGSREALWMLSELRLISEGVTSEGLRMLREAALKGAVPAMLRMQGLAVSGSAPGQDGVLARRLLKRAAASGEDEAVLALSRLMFYDAILGQGPDPTYHDMLNLAAKSGSVVAVLERARAYETGILDPLSDASSADRAYFPAFDPNGAPSRMLKVGRAYRGQTAFGDRPDIAADWFRKCAELGDVRCHAELAQLGAASLGENIVTPTEAEQSRQIAAEAGIAGALFAGGTAGERNIPDARTEHAAELGYVPAMLAMLDASRDRPGQYQEALRWFDQIRTLASVDVERLVALGRAYRDGMSLPRDREFAAEAFRKAAVLGSAVAMRELGNLILSHPESTEREEGRVWLRKAASLGDVPAMGRLSEMYFDGWDGHPDPELGFKWALLAASRGSVKSRHVVADALETGFGTPVNQAGAEDWWREAAEAGDTEAMVILGERAAEAAQGEDGSTALDWFRQAAALGDGHALFLLGKAHQEGRFTTADATVARAFFEEAAAHGSLLSIYTLSRLRDQTHPAPAPIHDSGTVN